MTAVKFNYKMTPDQIVAGQNSLKRRGAKARDDQHKVNVSILHNWATGGAANVAAERAAYTVNNCDSYYAQAIVNWFTVHAGFAWDADEKKFSYSKTKISADEFQSAKGETFVDLTPPSEPKPFKLDDKIATLITAAENRMKAKADKRTDEDDIDPAHIEALKAILNK